MLLDDLGDLLTTGGLGATSTSTGNPQTIFLGRLPELPDACVSVFETGGAPPVRSMNSGPATVVEYPRVQVLSRAVTYAAARSKANSAFKLLDGFRGRTLNGTRYLWGEAVQSPFGLPEDENKRKLVACNYQLVKELT